MATIKSFSDLQQSKKLAEFLPIESADMYYSKTKILNSDETDYIVKVGTPIVITDVPCWSLAALLDVLPDEVSSGEGYQNKYEIKIRRYYGGNNITLYQIAYGNNKGSSGNWHDMINTSEQEKFVDVCCEMIVKLHKQNLL